MKRNFQSLVLSGAVLATALVGLSGCAPLIVGGAVMPGIVATDRRTTGAQVEDEGIELKVASAVRQELGERVHLNVTSFNRKVLLSGEARTQADKERAEKLAQSQDNVQSGVNDLGGTAQQLDAALQRRGDHQPGQGRFCGCQRFAGQRLQGGDRARRGVPDGPRDGP